VSAAKRDGWWVPDVDRVHVAVRGNASRISADGLHLHWAGGPAPVGHTTVIEPVVNVLFQVARCLPRIDALAVWESAIRKGRADPGVLSRVAWRSAEASALASVASALSDSGLETRFVVGMRELGIEVRQQVVIDGHPVDGLIGDCLVVQLDGFAHHSQPGDRRRDIAADARLVLLGYTVLRFDYAQIFFAWDEVVSTIQLAMAQGLHIRQVRRIR
jgi:very-short-patch-repair endonuclease